MVEITEKLKPVPEKPGVYLMKDQQGEIIYVGKARSLKSRIRSYFHTSQTLPKVRALREHIADFTYLVTDNEVEALILESNLIKKYRPKYNVLLKDDKSYPYLKITLVEEFPRIFITRSRKDDGSRYFGPYTNVGALKETLKLLRKLFPFRKCRERNLMPKGRPCLNAQIDRCLAPCTGKVDPEVYRQVINEVILFLEGRRDEVVQRLTKKMEAAAGATDFETAARCRNQLEALEKVDFQQKVQAPEGGDQDVFALAELDYNERCIQLFPIREGRLLGSEYFLVGGTAGVEDNEVLTSFVKQYYNRTAEVPREILLPLELEDTELIRQWLQEKRGGRVEIRVPRRGRKKRLLEMVAHNAELTVERLRHERETEKEWTIGAVKQLQDMLGLSNPPRRIECFDISNIQGTAAVGSLVVFVDGRPETNDYRRFRLRTVQGPDDFASMVEVVTRHYRRLLEEKRELPDLVLVDGGRGQLSAAGEELDRLGLGKLPLFGLAEEHELLFRRNDPRPLVLPREAKALYLLQRVRDEAHRFAINYHRRLRGRRSLTSVLDEVPGIGERRKHNLLKHFGSLKRLKEASKDELAAVDGMNRRVAAELFRYLQRNEIGGSFT